jgi:hypothetical protein
LKDCIRRSFGREFKNNKLKFYSFNLLKEKMSKIKKLATRFKDSVIFAPKMSAKKRKLSLDNFVDEKKVYTLEEAIKEVEKIKEEVEKIQVEEEYKKKVEKENKIIKTTFSDLIYMSINGRINQNKINIYVNKAQNSLQEIKSIIENSFTKQNLIPSSKDKIENTKKPISSSKCSLFSSDNKVNEKEVNDAFNKLEFTQEERENYLKKDPEFKKRKIILTSKVIDELNLNPDMKHYFNELIDEDKMNEDTINNKQLEEVIRGYMDIYVKTSCDPLYISKNLMLKLSLEISGEFSRDVLKDMEIRNVEDEELDDLGLSFIADTIREEEKNKSEIYRPSQLKNTYTKITESFIIKNYNKNEGKVVLEYLKFIKDNPEYSLPTLLWLDTFHDFKEERLVKGNIDLNKIIDYLCYKLYGKHWFGLEENEVYTYDQIDVTVGHYYNFDKLYQNSFFIFNKDKQVTGFHPDVKHTILKDIPSDKAKLLYNISCIFIQKLEFEADFFYAYLMYNFNFELSKEGLLNNLKDVFWSQIDDESIPYYAKDVDKGSGNLFKGYKVIIPASLFDANTSNSSKNKEDFVDIDETEIRLANAYNFVYSFNDKNCKLELKYKKSLNDIYTLSDPVCNRDNINNENKENQKNIKTAITTLSKTISKNNIYNEEHVDDILDIETHLTRLNEAVKKLYFKNKCISLPEGTQGMSPVDIVSIIISLLYKSKPINDNINSPIISCKILDFWVALKRIGDFGQILQCKKLGIPLFTTDNMQLLISIASCSSVVWTPDYTKVLWYNSQQEAIMCNKLAENKTICNKTRIEPKRYTYYNIINTLLGIDEKTISDVNDKLKRASHYDTYDTIIKDKLPDIPNIRN